MYRKKTIFIIENPCYNTTVLSYAIVVDFVAKIVPWGFHCTFTQDYGGVKQAREGFSLNQFKMYFHRPSQWHRYNLNAVKEVNDNVLIVDNARESFNVRNYYTEYETSVRNR